MDYRLDPGIFQSGSSSHRSKTSVWETGMVENALLLSLLLEHNNDNLPFVK